MVTTGHENSDLQFKNNEKSPKQKVKVDAEPDLRTKIESGRAKMTPVQEFIQVSHEITRPLISP